METYFLAVALAPDLPQALAFPLIPGFSLVPGLSLVPGFLLITGLPLVSEGLRAGTCSGVCPTMRRFTQENARGLGRSHGVAHGQMLGGRGLAIWRFATGTIA